jgi:uncharacterized OB-fold protein
MSTAPYLERCTDCEYVQYPPRGFCSRCLSAGVDVAAIRGPGALVSWTALHLSLEPAVSEHLPLTIVSVKLDEGPVVIAYFHGEPERVGQPVKLASVTGPAGTPVLVARAKDDSRLPETFLTAR